MSEYEDYEIEDGIGLIAWMMGMLIVTCIVFSAMGIVVWSILTGAIF